MTAQGFINNSVYSKHMQARRVARHLGCAETAPIAVPEASTVAGKSEKEFGTCARRSADSSVDPSGMKVMDIFTEGRVCSRPRHLQEDCVASLNSMENTVLVSSARDGPPSGHGSAGCTSLAITCG